MKQLSRTLFACLLLGLALCLGLSGCSGEGGKSAAKAPAELSKASKQALLDRVTEKWQAMEKWDYGAVYDYTTPTYRSVFSKTMYLNKFGTDIRWELTGADVVNYDAQAAVASVAVRVMSESTKQTTLAAGMGQIPNTVYEKWIFIEGEWWNNAK